MTIESKLEERLRCLEGDHRETRTLLEEHVKSCDKRNDMILKIVLWVLLGVGIVAVEQTFNIHVPTNIPTL